MSVEQLDAQQREVLTRLHENETNPDTLEAFEEGDLERMICDATRYVYTRPRPGPLPSDGRG